MQPMRHVIRGCAAALVVTGLAVAPVVAAGPGVSWTDQVSVGPIQQETCGEGLARTTVNGRIVLHVASTRGGGLMDSSGSPLPA